MNHIDFFLQRPADDIVRFHTAHDYGINTTLKNNFTRERSIVSLYIIAATAVLHNTHITIHNFTFPYKRTSFPLIIVKVSLEKYKKRFLIVTQVTNREPLFNM